MNFTKNKKPWYHCFFDAIFPVTRAKIQHTEKHILKIILEQTESLKKEISIISKENASLKEDSQSLLVLNKSLLSKLEELADAETKQTESLKNEILNPIDKINSFYLKNQKQLGRIEERFNFIFNYIYKKNLKNSIEKGILPLRFFNKPSEEQTNWGDDLNVKFLETVSGLKVQVIRTSDNFSTEPNLLPIGSIIQHVNLGTTIWGSGMIAENWLPKNTPIEILAVRGPLTRRTLIKNGFKCPEIYGDPALLLPLFYTPKKFNNKKIVVIPHYHDREEDAVKKLENLENVCLIDMKKYNDWRDPINQIANADFVISSSLHGIIVAEAYGVPSIWVKFSDKVYGNGFKFRDFYESIGKININPIKIEKEADLEELSKIKSTWTPGSIDLQPLIAACPFPLKNKISNNY